MQMGKDGAICGLNWRAEKVSEFFQTLDSRASANRKEFMEERTKRTSSGESRKRVPTDAPDWAIKSPVATREIRGAASASRRACGCGGIRTREVVEIMEAEGWRQIQHQQGGKLHFLPRTF